MQLLPSSVVAPRGDKQVSQPALSKTLVGVVGHSVTVFRHVEPNVKSLKVDLEFLLYYFFSIRLFRFFAAPRATGTL